MGVSERKIAANRRNAMKSTGPRTVQGKARTRMNGYRHGLAALSNGKTRVQVAMLDPNALAERMRHIEIEQARLVFEIEQQMWEDNGAAFGQILRRLDALGWYYRRCAAAMRRRRSDDPRKEHK